MGFILFSALFFWALFGYWLGGVIASAVTRGKSPRAACWWRRGIRLACIALPFWDVVPGSVQFAWACNRSAGFHQYESLPAGFDLRCPGSIEFWGSACNDKTSWLLAGQVRSVEAFGIAPFEDFTRTKPGVWSRFWLAQAGDPACGAYDAAVKRSPARALSNPEICLATRIIERPSAPYSLNVRTYESPTWARPYAKASVALRRASDSRVIAQYLSLSYLPWLGRLIDIENVMVGFTCPRSTYGPRYLRQKELMDRLENDPLSHSM